MGKNIRNNGVNLIALYKSVDPSICLHTGLKKRGVLQRFREMVKIVIAENFCRNTDKDGTAYSSKQYKCCIFKECWTSLSLIGNKKVFSKIKGEQNSELMLFSHI